MTLEELDDILAPLSADRAAWCHFDAAWYHAAYPGLTAQIDPDDTEALRALYLEQGVALGHSPSMLFDEAWYRSRHPEVVAAIAAGAFASGYEHYCRIGYPDHSPHWLYDDEIYALYSADLTDEVLAGNGCLNRYDHYLKAGSYEDRLAHRLFEPTAYRQEVGEDAALLAVLGPFRHFLHQAWFAGQDSACSVYFDDRWFLSMTPAAAAAVAERQSPCALHYYLTAAADPAHDPRPEFDEAFYRARNPDAAEAIRSGSFASGYAHFLRAGVFELRDPCSTISLTRVVDGSPALRTALAEGRVRDAFAWVLTAGPEARALALPPEEPVAAVRAVEGRIIGHGHVDLFGFHTPGHAWVFCGWIDPLHGAADGQVHARAHFDRGIVEGDGLICHFTRGDLTGGAAGFVLTLEDSGHVLGELLWLNLSVHPENGPEQSWRVATSGMRAGLRDEALMGRLRPIASQLHPSGAQARVAAVLEQRGYAGENTVGSLRERMFLEIDQTILCPPHGVMLAGWMLAPAGAVRTIRLHCGARQVTLRPERFLWVDRADVHDSVGVPHGLTELRCGFIAYAELPPAAGETDPTAPVLTPGEPAWLAVETVHGETGFRGITQPVLSGIAAIKFLLQSFDLRYEELVRAMEDVVGPAVAGLNRGRLQDRGSPQIIRFGSAAADPVVSVIVPLYGRLDFMEYQFALGCLHHPTIAREFIYVLDEPGRQREAEMLGASVFARFGVPFSLVLMPRNLGYGPANNAGLAIARGQYVCFLNSDVFPRTADWLERLVARMQADSSIGAIGPLLLFEDESVQHLGMGFEALPEFGGWMFPMHERKGWRPPAEGGLRFGRAITGACMVLERGLAVSLGGFDESFVIGDFEDSDLCLRLAKRGFSCCVDLDVSMFHLERQSQSGSEERWRMNLTLFNAWVHETRWGKTLRAPVGEPKAEAVSFPRRNKG